MPGGHGDSLWWLGRAPEIQALKRLARDHPHAVRPEVAESYRFARLNSISTLQAMQRAGESLLPVAGVRYHTIAGDLHGQGGDAFEFFTQEKVVVERWPRAWSRTF